MMLSYVSVVCYVPTETTQEVAASGLSLLYERCAPEQKEHVVNMLVDTLLGRRRLVVFLFGLRVVYG